MTEYSLIKVNSVEGLGKCRLLRHAVFVDEQGIDQKTEDDGNDLRSHHFLGLCKTALSYAVNAVPAATGRLLRHNHSAVIQRVAVHKDFRGNGLGYALMNKILDYARYDDFSYAEVSAQLAVVEFFERLGFETFGEVNIEDNVEHLQMRLIL